MNNYSALSAFSYLAATYASFVTTGKVLSFPRIVQIQTASSCNGHCVFCPYARVSRHLPQGTMEASLFYKIIDQVSMAPRCSEILFELHNEPLLDQRTFQFIKYVKTQNKNKACTLVTNGQAIDKFSLADITQSHVDKFLISLNAHSAEMYERISGGLDYNRIKKNIAAVLAGAELRPKVTLSFVATEQTAGEISQARRYWKERGISTTVTNVMNRAGVLENFEFLRLKNNNSKFFLSERIRESMKQKMHYAAGCFKPFSVMTILYNGDVILCCQDWNRTTIVGNVNVTSLREIWNSPEINEIRSLIIKKKYSHIDLCRNCSEATRH